MQMPRFYARAGRLETLVTVAAAIVYSARLSSVLVPAMSEKEGL